MESPHPLVTKFKANSVAEAGWLLEHDSGCAWLGVCPCTGNLRLGSASEAVRFAREEDAVAMARALRQTMDLDLRPSAHCWGT